MFVFSVFVCMCLSVKVCVCFSVLKSIRTVVQGFGLNVLTISVMREEEGTYILVVNDHAEVDPHFEAQKPPRNSL